MNLFNTISFHVSEGERRTDCPCITVSVEGKEGGKEKGREGRKERKGKRGRKSKSSGKKYKNETTLKK